MDIPEIHPVAKIRDYENSIDDICACPNNETQFASSTFDPKIKVWDIQADSIVCNQHLVGHTKGVWSLQYDSNGTKLLSAGLDSTVKVWDIKSN